MKKVISIFLLTVFSFQLFFPTISYALTGGPSQPEMEQFQQAGTSQNVNLFTGDFSYNIPLMDVGGYPINISYQSGITMDQEASWVGLGWNINPGSITRNLRGLPDEFKGDTVTKIFNIKPTVSFGISARTQLELFGKTNGERDTTHSIGSLGFNLGLFYNNYKGFGISYGISPNLSCGLGSKMPLNVGLGLNFNSQEGVNVSADVIKSVNISKDNVTTSNSLAVGTSLNSRSGLKALTIDLQSERIRSKVIDGKLRQVSSTQVSGFNSEISFATPTYIPNISMPMQSNNYSVNVTVGLAFMGAHPDVHFGGFYSENKLTRHFLKVKAYGYNNSEAGAKNDNILLDFNREGDIPYNPTNQNLAIPNFTYDLYSINGQGIGGQFRPYRGDVGILFDNSTTSGSQTTAAGLDFGIAPNVAHDGFSLNHVLVNSTSGKWKDDNDVQKYADFNSENPLSYNQAYEEQFYKNVGEPSYVDTAFNHSLLDKLPVQVVLEGVKAKASMRLDDINTTTHNVINKILRENRAKRSQVITALNAAEASNLGLDKYINFYPANIDSLSSDTHDGSSIFREIHPINHTSEIDILNEDGRKYVYGIPAYNNYQKEITFAVEGTPDSNNLISYSPGYENSPTGNTKGKDHYVNGEILPPYAHSYLLTGVLSSDYIDVAGDGITPDDKGEATKINYSRISSNYKWRIPYDSCKANFNVGLKGEGNYDKGSYLYGEKETWYVQSIESKTMVAKFILHARNDGLGVLGENGGKDTTNRLYSLKEIRLYSKSDLARDPSKAIPVQTVHFVYDYSLCPGIKNSTTPTSGKLTLKEIYFTYGNNTGRINSYKFSYTDFNPGYNLHNYDRWGCFMSNDSIAKWNGYGTPPNYDYPVNTDYPYTFQDTSITNKFSSAWTLNKIVLPSGGEMNINYESKDYAYVQDQRAGQMYLIKGFAPDTNYADISPKLYAGPMTQNPFTYGVKHFMFIDVGTAVTSYDVLNRYLDGLDNLYYKCLVDLDNNGKYEYITGYAEIDRSDCGVSSANNHVIYIKIKDIDGHQCIAAKSWQIIRQNYPNLIYPYSEPGFSVKTLVALVGIFPELYRMIKGFSDFCITKKFGEKIKTGRTSWARLNNPKFNKLGGGCRVQSIALNDKWSGTGNGGDVSYGQTYDYSETKVINGVTYKVSTGVAAYEPTAGGDENSMHKPLSYDIKAALAPTTEMYLETPLGESLFPAPSIGYRLVTVKSISNAASRSGTGKETHEFYTAYDFPVRTYHTTIANKRFKPKAISLFLATVTRDFMTVSQGYTVEVNDMHGKPKCDKTYNQAGDVIASSKYIYKTNDPDITQKGLTNSVDYVRSDGSIEHGQMGVDIDMWMDMRQQETITTGVEPEFNGDGFVIPFVPAFIFAPMVWGRFTSEKSRFRSAVSVKYIQQYGILDRVEKMVDGSFAATQNLLYDKETGEVLLTKITNEFNDSIFNFNYPAYWYYPAMGQAYKNVGTVFKNVSLTGGYISSTLASYFADGDEIYISNYIPQKGWITKTPGGTRVIDYNGNYISSTNSDIKIIKSGYKNQASSVIGTLAMVRKNPINTSGKLDVTNSGLTITQASAREFKDGWRTNCEKVQEQRCDGIGRYMGDAQSCIYYFTKEFLDSCKTTSFYSNILTTTRSLPYFLSTISPYCDSIQGVPSINYTWVTISYPDSLPLVARINNCTYTISKIPGAYSGLLTLKKVFVGPTASYNSDGCLNLYDSGHYSTPIALACFTCDSCYTTCKDSLTAGQTINPYRLGLKNNWHEKAVWAYNGIRYPESGNAKPQTDGYFTSFTPFWNFTTVGDTFYKSSNGSLPWVKTNEITNLNTNSAEIENKDALGVYSSALYGYLGSMPKAVAKNSNYRNMAFDGFEDYTYTLNPNVSPCVADYWNFEKGLSGDSISLTKTCAHTGKYSLKLTQNKNVKVSRDIKANPSDTLINLSSDIYKLKDGCLNKFSPQTGYYQFSAWIKEDTCCNPLTYNNSSINVSFTGSGTTYNFYPSGPIIEGWQRIDTVFQVPSSATQISVKLVSGNKVAYFDDIRIAPFNSEMKSFVYDAISTRLMAELDANNYATFYEYDDAGKLIRVKKETEKGIMTIKETRSTYIKYK